MSNLRDRERMANLPQDTPPPPSPSQAPPSYDSLSDHGTHIHSVRPRYHFTTTAAAAAVNHHPSVNIADSAIDPSDSNRSELELNRLTYSEEDVYNDNSVEGLISDHFDTTEDHPDDPPPPYSPGLRYIRAVSGIDNVFVADPPPSYNSLFGQIREAREHSQSNLAFLKRLCEIILNTVGCTILLIVFMSVPLAILVLGSVYLNDCPLEPKIPIFLIIGGISGVLKNVLLIVENVLKRHSRTLSRRFKRQKKWIVYIWRAFNLVFNLFMLAWIITGSYWIFSSYSAVHSNDFTNCNELLYKFGFSIVISSYILLVLMCCCTCICAGICLRRNKDQEEGEGEEEDEGDEDDREGEEDREGGSRDFGENELLAREAEGEEEEETELNDGYLNGHHHHRQYDHHNGVDDQIDIDISDEVDLNATDHSREPPELLTSPIGAVPPVRLNNGLVVHQYDSSPYPSRHHFTVRRVYSSGANLNSSDLNMRRNVSGGGGGDDLVIEDNCFQTGNLQHANSSNLIPVLHGNSGSRHDRPLSLSHVESHSHDSIPAMRACALIRNRVHHSSHSSGLYITQYSDGFSVTAV